MDIRRIAKLIDKYCNLGIDAIIYLYDNNLDNVGTIRTFEHFGIDSSQSSELIELKIPKYKYIYRDANRIITYKDLSIAEVKVGVNLGTIYREAVNDGYNKIEVYREDKLEDVYQKIKKLSFENLFIQLNITSIQEYLDMLKSEYHFKCIEEYKILINTCYNLSIPVEYNLQPNIENLSELCELVGIIDNIVGREKIIDLREEFMEMKVISKVADINALEVYTRLKKERWNIV